MGNSYMAMGQHMGLSEGLGETFDPWGHHFRHSSCHNLGVLILHFGTRRYRDMFLYSACQMLLLGNSKITKQHAALQRKGVSACGLISGSGLSGSTNAWHNCPKNTRADQNLWDLGYKLLISMTCRQTEGNWGHISIAALCTLRRSLKRSSSWNTCEVGTRQAVSNMAGTPIAGCFRMEHAIKTDDLGGTPQL